MPVREEYVLLWFPYIIVYFPTILKGSLCLPFKVQLYHPDFRGFGWVVTQCGIWKREGKIHKYTIEIQFSYRKTAVHIHGGVGRFANLAVK